MTTLLGDSIEFEFPIRRATNGTRFQPTPDPTVDLAIGPNGAALGSSLVWDATNLLYKYTTSPTVLSGPYYVAILVADTAADSPVYDASEDVISIPAASSDTSSFSGAAATEIDAIKAMTDKFSLPGLIFSPLFGSPDGAVKIIYRWRDYLVTNGQQLDYQILGLDVTDTMTWTISCAGKETTKTLDYVAADIPLARLELTKAESGLFTRGDWPYEIFVTNILGDKAEKYYGTIRVKDILKK